MSLLKKYKFDGSEKFKISKVHTSSKKDNVSKKEILKKTEENQAKIFALQDKLYADGKEGLLVILQARDAAGKDSTIRHVMAGVNPQGVSVYSYKQPSKEELAHDYLWRCNKNLPQRGMIAIFNRSYYEDVLVVRVDKLYEGFKMADRCLDPRDFIAKRLKHIRHYEDYLYDNSYRIVKIFLNVSKEKQKERFLERIDTPEKNWKFSSSDIQVREHWDEYDEAYEDCINATATKDCPWYVIPADQKWYSRYLVSEAILDALEKINPQYPVLPDDEKARLAECKAMLKSEGKKKPAVEYSSIDELKANLEAVGVEEETVADAVDEVAVDVVEEVTDYVADETVANATDEVAVDATEETAVDAVDETAAYTTEAASNNNEDSIDEGEDFSDEDEDFSDEDEDFSDEAEPAADDFGTDFFEVPEKNS